MSEQSTEKLSARVQELELEISEREKDLAKYRLELSKANTRLEGLISHLRQELKLAHAIQKILVPTEFPHIQGFEFSTKFVPSMVSGGDYFDIFSHDDRLRFGLVVASGSGHSMSALFLSVLLKFTGQMEARRGAEPAAILDQMFKELLANMEPDGKADIFYGFVDRRSYELRFCRLGETVALLQAFPGGELKLLESSGSTVTKNFSTSLVDQTVALNPRDKLVICTRGVLEAKNLAGESFGLERLSRSLASGPKRTVHEVRNQILFELERFAGGQEVTRDQTILVLEVKDRVIKLAKN